MIHLGNGMQSQGEVYEVIKKLQDAYNTMSGLQQGININSPEYKNGMFDIEMAIIEIAMSFGIKIKIDDGKIHAEEEILETLEECYTNLKAWCTDDQLTAIYHYYRMMKDKLNIEHKK